MIFKILLLLISLPLVVFAEEGVTDKAISFGSATSLSGALQQSGDSIIAGYEAAFDRANRAGGIFGRKLRLTSYDDAYQPMQTVELTKKLILHDNCFALIGYNGTSTAKAALPIAIKHEVPFLFPRTGEEAVRDFVPQVFNFRPSYNQEVESLLKYAVSKRKTEVAILYQIDSFGDVLRTSALNTAKVMGSEKIKIAALVGLNRNANKPAEFKEAFEKLKAKKPDAVLLATSLTLSEHIVRLEAEQPQGWIFLGVSGTNNLANKIADINSEVIFTQVTSSPYNKSSLSTEFEEDLEKTGKSKMFGYTAFESYINGRLISEAVQRAGKNLTRKAFLESLESKPFSLGQLSVSWSPTEHNAKSKVYLTVAKHGKFTDINE